MNRRTRTSRRTMTTRVVLAALVGVVATLLAAAYAARRTA